MSALEVATFDQIREITDLSRAVHAGDEPGFQVDGVRNSDELQLVFDALLTAAPDVQAQVPFGGATLHLGAIARIRSRQGSTQPHADSGFFGLAVHHNISDIVPVTLATSLIGNYVSTDFTIDPEVAINFREGQTIPGRLTVFAEGGFPWLKKTIHFFDRRAATQVNHWARYHQGGSRGITKKVARVFAELEQSGTSF